MSRRSSATVAAAGAAVLMLVLLGALLWQAGERGQSVGEYVGSLLGGVETPAEPPADASAAGAVRLLDPQSIGEPIGDTPPWITHVAIVDLDADGLKDVVLADAKAEQIAWIRQAPDGTFAEIPIGSSVPGPAHVTPSDVDGDGDMDVLVAVMGTILPNNDTIGAVVVLENDGNEVFVNRTLIDNVARVTDVEPGDFDGDGDIDLAVGQFGYFDGEIRWMENLGDWQFASHQLLSLSGTIHTPVGDLDGDGDLDIAAVVSQEWEEIHVFENDGRGGFQARLVYGATNEDFGSSGISLADLDLDGDLDIIYTNGDAFDYVPPGPRPWHGVQWLENRGGLEFTYHRIGDYPGAYFANAVDGDRDGDIDLFLVSAFNDWESEGAQSFSWFENDGSMGFTLHALATAPTHLLTLASDDLDGDGWIDFVTGGMYAYPPYDRMGRVMLWRNAGGGR